MKTESAIQSTNKVILMANWGIGLFLIIGYIIEFFKGGRTLGFVIGFIILILIPLLIASYLYYQDREDLRIKIVTLGGFLLVYTVVLFTTTRMLVYVYMFPILAVYILCFDLSLIMGGRS